MLRTTAIRQFVALVLAELLFFQPLQSYRSLSAGTAEAAPAPRSVASASVPDDGRTAADAASQDAQTESEAEVATYLDASSLKVSVGFADGTSPSANFPTPWQGAPNVVFLGAGDPVNAGAIRLDNSAGVAMRVDRVTVDLQRANARFALWENFTIPARGSVILTQTAPGNFDTSAYPLVGCGEELPAGDTHTPTITISSGGSDLSFSDTAHVLDTGGFDSSCRGNESLQWRAIATRGIDAPAGELALSPATSHGAGGSPITILARLRDANATPLANVVVDFKAISGPNSGQTGQSVTDARGEARFTYTGSAQGADVVQASVANASGATFTSNDVTVEWETASCGPDVPLPPSGEASLVYIGMTRVQYSDTLELAALLTDADGAPVAGRVITFTFAGQAFTAVTDSTGVARVTMTADVAPADYTVAADFAGAGDVPALHITQNLTVAREDVLLQYTGRNLLGTAVPQQVSATLRDPDTLAPIAGRTLTFTVGAVQATAVTDANGVASTTITLGPDQVSGPGSLTVSFAGDVYYEPAFRTVAVTIYLSTSFVIWGGNDAGLRLGQHVNFWGARWEAQVLQGDYPANASFKGLADPVDQIHICQPNVRARDLTPTCWTSKGGQTWPPPLSVPSYIEVIVSTAIARQGPDTYGNIAAAVVVKVDPTPAYGPDPGKPGYGEIVAVIEDSGVFPAPAVVTATQTQPATVLPNQTVSITANLANTSPATAATNVVLTETLDGLTPDSVTRDIGTISPNGTQSVTFTASTPSVSIRQSGESEAEYLRRLASLNGRVFTAAGQVTFTDANNQSYLPVPVSSQSVLTIPVLTLALTGPSVVTPGTAAPYRVTVTNVGSANADGEIDLTLPNGEHRTIAVDDLAPGLSFTAVETFTAEAIAAKGADETTEQYLARLRAADGELLTASAELTWRDDNGNDYGDIGQRIFTSRIRVPVLELTSEAPATLLPTQTATLRFTVRNSGGCTAVLSNLQVTNPDDSVSTLPQFVLAAGESKTLESTWRVPEVPKRDEDGETDAQYLARLQSVNNSNLDFDVSLDWSDPAGALYGPLTDTVQSKEIISIVPISLSAPATADAGTTITYTIGATNVGSATAPQTDLTITLPDGSMTKPAVPSLAPGATFQTTIDYAIPQTQAAGVIHATAFAMWTDIASNAYGPFEADAATEVTNPTAFNSLVLTPAIAGPNVKGTTQTMTATLKDPAGAPIANATVQFTVTGANPTTGSATTDAAGIATFTYTGNAAGTDTVQATSGSAVSNSATISWITPVQKISTSPMFARYFTTNGSGVFNTPPTATPAFIQAFPTINFNPPAGTVPGNTSGVGVNTRPFTNVTTDLNGNFTGTIVAEGNGLRAGVGTLFDFQAVYTGSFTVASAGDMVISFFSDDGFIFGVGNGATRVSGPMLNVPAGGVTPFEKLPVIGAYNAPTSPVANRVVVHFPEAGLYPYEVDYSECCGGQLALTVTAGNVSTTGVPPTGSLKLTPINLTAKPTGQTQTLTVEAFDGGGAPVANAGVALIVNGPNAREIPATTDEFGRATFSYSGVNAGTDTAQAVGRVAGLGTFSNVVNVPWTVGSGGGTDPELPPGNIGAIVTQGWIGAPLIGSTITTRTNITSTTSMTSGILDYWPSDDPSQVTVLNGNVRTSGTIGVFDPTVLANGEYVIRLRGTLSNGTQQTSLIVVTVTGDNKPGRVTKFVTDLRLPVAGMPVTISRRYDSLERGRSGDFGYGWSLSTAVRLDVNKKNDVTFTLNGRRQTFQFKPQSAGFPFSFFLYPRWLPEPGSYGTLTAESCGLLVLSGGTFTCFLDIPGSFAPTSYTYTDPYGRQYVMGADGEMKSVKDLSGNTLSFTRDGIFSSASGINVPFTRDANGRITRITDPAGNEYDYTYDSSGDLTEVHLPTIANPVQYEYASGHYLTKEIDPRGASSSATYYADGRLETTTDRMGNVTRYAYNLSANTVTYTYPDGGVLVRTNNSNGDPISIRDQLNRTTTFTYDANHNLLTRTDALGKTWTFTYDANGNVTSVRDPLGNTSVKNWDSRGRLLSVTDALNQVKTFDYDSSGNVTALRDTLGQIMGATYDSRGNQTSMTLPSGQQARFTQDSFGNITTLVDHSGFSSTMDYNAIGQLTAIRDSKHGEMTMAFDVLGNQTMRRDPLGHTLQLEYDFNGNPVSETDPDGHVFGHEYDANDREIRTNFPDGTHVEMTYDYAGHVLTRTNESGVTDKFVWDKAGQLTSTISAFGTPSAATTTFTYDPAGRLISIIDARNSTTVLTYDDAGRVKAIRDPAGRSTSFTYDANGQVLAATRADNARREARYDIRGRTTTLINPDGTTRQTEFDGMRLRAVTGEDGRTMSYTYDNHGEIASVTDPAGQVTSYTRDAVGNLTTVRDPNGHETTYEYDAADRLIKKTLPDGSYEQYTYDGAGHVTSTRLTDGHVNRYTWDERDRLVRIDYFDGTSESYTYTPTGKRNTSTGTSGVTRYAYDSQDRLTSITHPNGIVVGYEYDGVDNVTAITTPRGTTRYTYDALNRVSTVTGPTGGVTTYAYDVGGRLIERRLPNGVITEYGYDSLDRLLSVTHHLGAAASFESFTYTFSPNGQRLTVTEAGGTRTNWTYDEADRLIRELVVDGNGMTLADLAFAYDQAGNRTSSTTNGVTTLYQYNALDQIVSAGPEQYTYDARGNLTRITNGSATTTYAYDAANRLTRATLPDGTTTDYAYDATDHLIRETTGGVVRNYAWNELSEFHDIVYEGDGGGNPVASYVYGAADTLLSRTGAAPSYYLQDGLGSVIGLTDSTGFETDRYRYDAWGVPTLAQGTTPNPFGYRAQFQSNAASLLYLRARFFAPAIGRFLTRDTIDFQLANPADLNRYNYAASNPINAYDPSGYSVAVEYGMMTREMSENATIEGYLVGRRAETLLSCALVVMAAMFVDAELRAMIGAGTANPLSGRKIWRGLPNVITIAFGWIVRAPLDAEGPDYAFNPATEVGEKALLAKAAMFRAGKRELAWAMSGRYINALFRYLGELIAGVDGTLIGREQTLADKCDNHAERKIVRHANPPVNALLSVGASRPVCNNCRPVLIDKVLKYTGCFGPIGTNNQCRP